MTAAPTRLLDDCFLHDKDRLRHDEALSLLAERLVPVAGVETVKLADAHRRVLAQAVSAPRDVPAFDNAAVDGYAFLHRDANAGEATKLKLAEGRAAAGHPHLPPVPPGETLRVLTGAPMPEGTNTVALQEDVRVEGGVAHLFAGSFIDDAPNATTQDDSTYAYLQTVFTF